jgi:hypothetical protein
MIGFYPAVRSGKLVDSPVSLIDLFNGHPERGGLLDQAEAGWLQILMPTAAIADAEVAYEPHNRPGADLPAVPDDPRGRLPAAGGRDLPGDLDRVDGG